MMNRFLCSLLVLLLVPGCTSWYSIDEDAVVARAEADAQRPPPELRPLPSPPPETLEKSRRSYVLGIEDIISITIYQNPELDVSQPIRPDGMISLLPIGEVEAAGLTPGELKAEIERRLASLIRDPIVNVVVAAYNSRKVAVIGAVEKPGILRLRSDVTLVEGISLAGGFTPDADLARALLVRNREFLPVSFERLFKRGDVSHNVVLQPDDTIFVPSAADNKVYVIGEVETPGVVSWQGDLSLLQAIPLAGGFTDDARGENVLVVSGGLAEPRLKLVDVRSITRSGLLENNVALESGDVVYVAKSRMADTERYLDYAIKIMQTVITAESMIILGKGVERVFQGTDVGGSVILNP